MEEFDSSALGRVTVYSIQGCPHCVQAKAILGRLGVPVCDVDVGRHPELRARVKELTGRSSVPQIFFNNIHVGGNDDLQKLAPEELQRLVNVVKKEPLPADAPPLPDENPPEDTTGETDGEFMCERDELADVIKDLKHGTVIGSHWRGLTLYKKSFSGDQLVDWLQKEKGMASAEACNTGQALLQKKYMVSVRGCGQQDGSFGKGKDALYRLLEDDPHSALNAGQTAACSPIQAAELSLLVRELVLKLFSEHLSADGKSVDYKGMSVNPAFERYCELAIQLQRVELLSLSREEKLAFFINIYNALVIHGYLRLGAPTNMWQRYRFFNYVSSPNWKEKFNYGMKWCSGGTERFAQLLRPFPKRPRYKFSLLKIIQTFSQIHQDIVGALPDAEPLIHFALNCGAKGCPNLKNTSQETLLKNTGHLLSGKILGLNSSTQPTTLQPLRRASPRESTPFWGFREKRMPQSISGDKADFGGTDEKLLKWVVEHMGDSPKKTSLQGVLSAGKTKVSFLPYDWSTNSTH
ncbi:uncharacterized protein zgc:152951 [Etheostoma spectabile]|uniref:uncharacterized protein zgc:152951 n=1 Tax=Etheostoma spectabile TaxID=54343 RepID=UPI0013AFA8CD|nr:uncharacterized protein LOC116698409 [Etheostoma spectabile]